MIRCRTNNASGSPVGRWAGYFLMQHKQQLGGNRFIYKVRVFKNEQSGSLSYFCFYVNPNPAPEGSDMMLSGRGAAHLGGVGQTSRVVNMSADGKDRVREHVLRM